MRNIITLTTTPSRINGKYIISVLKSLFAQSIKPDAIYLGIPSRSSKNEKYAIPDSILNFTKNQNNFFIVSLEQDLGPATKMLAGLKMEKSPNTILVTVDDDQIYHKTFFENIISKAREFPAAAVGFSGIIIGHFPFVMNVQHTNLPKIFDIRKRELPLSVDIVMGYAGAAYRRSFFGSYTDSLKMIEFWTKKSRSLFLNDDVLWGMILCQKNIRRYIFRPEVEKDFHIETYYPNNGLSEDALCLYYLSGALIISQQYGLVPINEYNKVYTIGGMIFIFAFLILFCIVLIFAIYFARVL